MDSKHFVPLLLLLFGTSLVWAQFSNSPKPKPSKIPSKLVLGVVLDQDDQPLSTAIVSLTNLKTHKVLQDITDDKGEFRFAGLDPDNDFDLQAVYHNVTGPKERISMYDTRFKREFYWKLPLKLSAALQEVEVLFAVADSSGRSIPGATFKFTAPEKIETLTTVADSTGRAHKWLSSQRAYSVVVEAPGYETYVNEAVKPERNMAVMQILLKAAR
jgi:hypothetical protein